MQNHLSIDPDAKCRVPLIKQHDANNQPYWIGKLQMPGEFEFSDGVSLMVFNSEEGVEELHIAPLDLSKRRKADDASLSNGRLCVPLNPKEDKHSEIYYIGEVTGPITMDLREGLFFTIFTSRSGEEELQICKLNHRKRQTNYRKDVAVYSKRRQWPPTLEESMSS